MASLNPESDIAAFVGTIFQGAILTARDNNVMTGLVRAYNDRSGLAVRQNSQYGGATMNTVAETDDLVGQAFTPSSIATLTPTEAAAQYMLTDSRVETDPFSVRMDAQSDLGEAMATKMETDLISDFTSFTAGTIGAAGSLITWSYLFAMETKLRNQKAPYPYFCVMTPNMWFQLAKAASVASSVATNVPDSLKEQVNASFFVRQAGGISLFVSGNFTDISGDDAYVGMWSRDALALDMRRQPRLEPERDASRRAWELNMSAVYAHGVWRPKFGCAGLFADDAVTGA